MTTSCLYDAAILHRRLGAHPHRLRTRVVSMLVDLDELPELSRRLRLFSAEGRAAIAFCAADHGHGVSAADPQALRRWVRHTLAANDLGDGAWGRIRVLAMPRILGHAFNPLTVFFCDDTAGRLRALIYQVDNTFGERHFYVVPAGADETGGLRQGCDKAFFVSPFLPMRMRYRFRLREPGETLSLAITGLHPDTGDAMIVAVMQGRRRPLSDAALLRVLLRTPLQGARVMFDIHLEALKLWLKGAPMHRRVPRASVPTIAGS